MAAPIRGRSDGPDQSARAAAGFSTAAALRWLRFAEPRCCTLWRRCRERRGPGGRRSWRCGRSDSPAIWSGRRSSAHPRTISSTSKRMTGGASRSGAMIGRVLQEELSQRLPGTSVFARPAPSRWTPTPRSRSTFSGWTPTARSVVLAAQIAVTFTKTRRPPNTRAVGLRRATGDAGHAKRSCGDERRAGATRRYNRRDVAGLEKSYIASAWLPF